MHGCLEPLKALWYLILNLINNINNFKPPSMNTQERQRGTVCKQTKSSKKKLKKKNNNNIKLKKKIWFSFSDFILTVIFSSPELL